MVCLLYQLQCLVHKNLNIIENRGNAYNYIKRSCPALRKAGLGTLHDGVEYLFGRMDSDEEGQRRNDRIR